MALQPLRYTLCVRIYSDMNLYRSLPILNNGEFCKLSERSHCFEKASLLNSETERTVVFHEAKSIKSSSFSIKFTSCDTVYVRHHLTSVSPSLSSRCLTRGYTNANRECRKIIV